MCFSPALSECTDFFAEDVTRSCFCCTMTCANISFVQLAFTWGRENVGYVSAEEIKMFAQVK
jgi:hypothetical protein